MIDHPLPSLDMLKTQAKRLRAGLAQDGDFISHSEALELIARQYGYRNWNTLHAAIGNRPPRFIPQIGARIGGAYLGQTFEGEIIAVQTLSSGRFRITIDFDEAVDVASAHVHLNHRVALQLLPAHKGIAFGDRDLGHFRKHHQSA